MPTMDQFGAEVIAQISRALNRADHMSKSMLANCTAPLETTRVRRRAGCRLPDGQISNPPVQPPLQKYSASLFGRNSSSDSAIPLRRGALAIVTNVGAGCGGRGSVGHAGGCRAGFP